MDKKNFFTQRPLLKPTIYAYEIPDADHKGLLKVGYTTKEVEERVAAQFPTKGPDGVKRYNIVLKETAVREDGSYFLDYEVHRMLEKKGLTRQGGEWFRCSVNDIKAAIIAIKKGNINPENRCRDFKCRPEQQKAIDKTYNYFISAKQEFPDRAAKFLWNAKMRFGKTFTSYKLAQKMGFTRILILTFKPAVESAWEEDLLTHIDFDGWQFISNKNATFSKSSFDKQYEKADKEKPIVCFGSFQDLLGKTDSGAIKAKNEWIHSINWDLIIFDEYHYGAWRDSAQKIFEKDKDGEEKPFDVEKYKADEADEAIDESYLQITTNYYLFLSGTPFRALNSGEFIEEQIFNWTYTDEQNAKLNWNTNQPNPYLSLPRMILMTYRLPDSIKAVAQQGEFDEFDLNTFFSTTGDKEKARFIYQNEVQKWLDLIHSSNIETDLDERKVNNSKKPPMPYSDVDLLNVLSHTLWFLPNVNSCYAMANLLENNQNKFFHKYKIINCAGQDAGIGIEALRPVKKAMGDPLLTQTITLTCGKLTTGVTVKPWTGILMLRNLKSPETYFQAAFRVQSPWTIQSDSGEKILKENCYVFDFALERALKQISDYSCQLNVSEPKPDKKVEEFIKFLPVLAYDGAKMIEVDAQDILDIATAGTSATLLAKRWESPLLVNVDNNTLSKILANSKLLEALMKIEGFRNLNNDIETIINTSKKIKKAKTTNSTPDHRRSSITQEEKELKSKRKQIREKLLKFVSRIPIFMYLTDYRESNLKDVITELEPNFFQKVTGLTINDFSLLCELNIFNSNLMNDAIFKFRRYEDASISYTGINKHLGESIGGWDFALNKEELDNLFRCQEESIQLSFK